MKIADALKLRTLSRAKVVAGHDHLDRFIRWVHVIDMPDPVPWLRNGDFMLTTGYSWPKSEQDQKSLIASLSGLEISGLAFAVPNYFERIPDATRFAAQMFGLPLLEIPWDIPFSSITEEVHGAIVATQYELLEKSESIHRQLMGAALEAETLQDIAATLGNMIGRSLIITQPDGTILASYDPGGGAWHRVFTTLSSQEKRSLIHRVMADVPLKRNAAGFEELNGHSVWPIQIRKELFGLLWILEGDAKLTELEVRAAEHATLVFALHLSWQKQLASLESQLGYSFLESLQDGQFDPTTRMRERAEILGFDPEGKYRMAMISLNLALPLSQDGIVKRERIVQRLRRKIQEFGTSPLLSFAQNQISLLIPEAIDPKLFWEICKSVPQTLFAVSRPYSGFEGVQKGFQEARSMLPFLSPSEYKEFENLLVPRLLMGDQEARDQFIQKIHLPFKHVRNGEILLETLLETARQGFQLKQCARSMNIHPKTLRYRLDKAIELGAFDLHDPDTQFQLQLAAQILSLRDKSRP